MFNAMHVKMSETDLKKIPFLRLLNLEAVTPDNDSPKILENHLLVSRSQNTDLIHKNNSIKTGYENFYIKKGALKLFPYKDFDFIGKHVVCQKCWQKFASKLSYRAHVGTEICVRTYNGPNLIYLKYKNRNYRQVKKKNKKKFEEDFHGHDIKKNLLNPEMLNTLQTRNKCYSDIIYQRNKVKDKPMNNSDNNEPSVKKPRGRPKKNISNNIISNNVEQKKRGRPRKSNDVSVDSSSKDDNSSSSNLEVDESEEPTILNICSADDAYNNNINERGKLSSLFSRMKSVSEKFWKLFQIQQNLKGVNFNEYQCSTQHQIQCYDEKKGELSVEEKAIFFQIDKLDNEFKFLCKRFQGEHECAYKNIEFKLKKLIIMRDEYIQSKMKKTDINTESIPYEGKENIQCARKMNDSEKEIELNKISFDKNEECVGIWINNIITSPIPMQNMIEGCKSMNSTNESKSKDSFENNLKTLTEDKTPNCTNSVNNHLNDLGISYIYNPLLNCRDCGRNFASIAEWKLHSSEHLAKSNKNFLCKICGLKFKMYKNFTKHVNIHKKTEQRKIDCYRKNFKNLVCKVCNKHYNYLRSYYAHIKTHIINK